MVMLTNYNEEAFKKMSSVNAGQLSSIVLSIPVSQTVAQDDLFCSFITLNMDAIV